MSVLTEPQLTTSQIAELYGVHASTIKRWFAEEDADVRTDGRHRRIPLGRVLDEAVTRGVRHRLSGLGDDAVRLWEATEDYGRSGEADSLHELFLEWIEEKKARLIGRVLVDLAIEGDAVSPALLEDVFGGFLEAVGRAWASGRFQVADERAASREVSEALIMVMDRLGLRYHDAPSAPCAVVGAVEGDLHNVGPLLVRTVLSLRGWSVEYLGADVPLEEFVTAQKAHGASLVCVSFAASMAAAQTVRCRRVLKAMEDPELPFELVLGGGGTRGLESLASAEDLHEATLFQSLVTFDSWLSKREPSHEG